MYICTFIHIYLHTYTYIYIYIHMYIYIYTYMYKYIHIDVTINPYYIPICLVTWLFQSIQFHPDYGWFACMARLYWEAKYCVYMFVVQVKSQARVWGSTSQVLRLYIHVIHFISTLLATYPIICHYVPKFGLFYTPTISECSPLYLIIFVG